MCSYSVMSHKIYCSIINENIGIPFIVSTTSLIQELNLNPEHRPHDPQMTFITAAKKAGIADTAIKKMAGHKIQDITESVYTNRDVEWLRNDIEKIK